MALKGKTTTPISETSQEVLHENPYPDGVHLICVLRGTNKCKNPECDGIHNVCDLSQRHSTR